METGAAGVLLVEKKSWKDEEVQEMVRKEGFHIVEETQGYVVLLPEYITDENVQDQDGYKSSEDTEEEINVITTCAPDIVDFISDDSAYDYYRGSEADEGTDLTQPGAVLYAAEWDLSGDRKLEEIGLKCLRLDAELLSEVSAPSTISFSGGRKQVKKVTISLGAFSITQEPISGTSAFGDMRRVVHRADIMLTPVGSWGEDNECLFLKVFPNATTAVTPVTMQKGRNVAMTVSPAQIKNPFQFTASNSQASTWTVKQQIWSAVPENKSAMWMWSIYAYNDGRLFKPHKTDVTRLRGGTLSQSFLDQLLAQPLTRPTFQVVPDTDVKATWTVDTEQLNVSELEFDTTVTLHMTTFRRVNVLARCFKMLQEKSDPQHRAIWRGKLSVPIAA